MAKVEILKVGHALVAGTRGEKGGAPSKDSIWGLAYVGGTLVKFFGRRGGVLRFKTEKKVNLPEAMAMFEDKLSGKGMDYNYKEVAEKNLETLVPDLANVVGKGYYAAVKAGKLNNRATAKAPKATA
jgi:hypothetical protein